MKFGMHLPFMGTPISATTLVILSDRGKRAVYSLNGSDLKLNFTIVQELDGLGGSATVLQIARAIHSNDIEDLKSRLRQLRSAGMVRFGGEESALPQGDME